LDNLLFPHIFLVFSKKDQKKYFFKGFTWFCSRSFNSHWRTTIKQKFFPFRNRRWFRSYN